MSMKNSNDTIGNRTLDLPTCSAVSQPTAPPPVPHLDIIKVLLPTDAQENGFKSRTKIYINPLNAELNPICHFLALLGAHHILHVSRIGVNFETVPFIA